MRFTKIVLAAAIALTGGAGGAVAIKRSDTAGPRAEAGAPAGAASVVRAAAETTKKTGSSRVSLDMAMGFLAQSVTMHGEGAFDYLAQKGMLDVTMKGADLPLGMGVGFQIVFADGVVYMRAPIPGAFGSKPWVKMDLGELATEQPGGLGMQNPADMLAFTQHAADIRAVGVDRVRGVRTTRYTMTLDISKELAESDPSMAEMFEAGFDALPAELWVDDQGLVRRFSVDMSGFAEELGDMMGEGEEADTSELTMKVSMDFFDFGTPVEVKVPDPSEVGDMSELADEEMEASSAA